jgi:eukaryotic-like serine/threonine-protein kinase
VAVGERAMIDDRYVLDQRIGRGGMAEVYRATDRLLGRAVAVKVMRDVGASETDRLRFAGEARTLARLSHPGLVTVLDAGSTGDVPYLVMELVDGPTLATVCAGSRLDPARVAAIGAQVADALAYAHGAGVVHRDVKPANILLGGDGRARLGDFGIARLMEDAARHTSTGLVVGTASYLAPEQLRGDDVASAADVYALGLVLIEALSGTPTYPGTGLEAAMARLSRPPTVPEQLSADWQQLLRAMTDTDPGARPSAADVAATLQGIDDTVTQPAVASGPAETRVLTTAVPRPEVAKTAMPAAYRGRRAWIGGAVAALVIVIVGAVLMLQWPPSGGGATHRVDMPTGVPPRFEQPLQDLHDALNGDAP